MTTESQEAITQPEGGEGEGQGNEPETVSLSKKDYETMNQTIGSLKRELKDLKKPKEEPKETPTTNQNQPDESKLIEKLEKVALRSAGITHQDDIDLARATAKKWGVDIDEVLEDDDFKVKLERQQTTRSNVEATSGIKGGAGGIQSAKNTPEYWVAKGAPPTAQDVPDRKTRAKIARAMMDSQKNSKKFYSD